MVSGIAGKVIGGFEELQDLPVGSMIGWELPDSPVLYGDIRTTDGWLRCSTAAVQRYIAAGFAVYLVYEAS